MKLATIVSLVLMLGGCAPFFMPPRERYDFKLDVTNESSYTLMARISYDDRAASDECSSADGSNQTEVKPNESKQVSISTLCHTEPHSTAYVSFPREAEMEKFVFYFNSGDQVLCTDDGCSNRVL